MKRKLIYLFIALAATIRPAHAQTFLNDALTLSNDGRHGKPNHRLGT